MKTTKENVLFSISLAFTLAGVFAEFANVTYGYMILASGPLFLAALVFAAAWVLFMVWIYV